MATAMLMTLAVTPAAMRVAGAPSVRAFAGTVAVITVIQLLAQGQVAPLVDRPWPSTGDIDRRAVNAMLATTPELLAATLGDPDQRPYAVNVLGLRMSRAAFPALLGLIGWHLGRLLGRAWLPVTVAWCGTSWLVLATTTVAPARWSRPLLALSLLAIGLAAAAAVVTTRPRQQA